MHRKLFVEMTAAEQKQWLEGIRERRLQAVQAYKDLQAAKQKVKDERLAAKAEQTLAMLAKEVAALEKAIEKVDKRRVLANAIRNMIEQES
jgi:hypothetical protein